jgi:hypothetical protein
MPGLDYLHGLKSSHYFLLKNVDYFLKISRVAGKSPDVDLIRTIPPLAPAPPHPCCGGGGGAGFVRCGGIR